MRSRLFFASLVAAWLLNLRFHSKAFALDIVVDGKPAATIVVEAGEPQAPAPRAGKRGKVSRNGPGDEMAAAVLVEWVKKMSGVELPVSSTAPQGMPAIFIGKAAVKAGLGLNAVDSSTHEGLRLTCDGQRILLAGQDGTSTVKAACRLLEQLGCRYFMDAPLGEVYPRASTLTVKELDLREKPGLPTRMIWGSSWSGPTIWKIWNGAGGPPQSAGHSWGRYVAKTLFETHPEYFALRAGVRKKGDWYCTSNPELRKIFAEGVMKALSDGAASISISPPDGTGYCECDKCRAQDDPNSIEPSSGRVSITDRYADFFNDIARQVGVKYPDAKLNFYCYADYTQPPTRGLKLEPSLVAWIAPLRYCRLHRIDSPICPTRQQLAQVIDGWSGAAGQIGYRAYNFNPAECLVPFSMASIWEHDIPYLQNHNAVGINLETLPAWEIYGPHIYLSLKLAYDPSADAAAIMDDYVTTFYGPAGPIMKRYWQEVDRAFAELHAHAGSFYPIHRVYNPAFLADCRKLLESAARAAGTDTTYSARVAMVAAGLQNAAQYAELRDAMNDGHPEQARGVYRDLLTRTQAETQSGWGSHYSSDYLKRFLGGQIEAAATAVASPGKLISVLPDRWQFGYDEQDKGLAAGYAGVDFDDSKWKTVATFSDTLDSQGLADNKTILWYRTTLDVPAGAVKPALFFVEVDATAIVYINGKEAGASAKKRTSFEVDGSALHPGKNTVAVRVDHSAITELFLGGITRPVYLIDKQAK